MARSYLISVLLVCFIGYVDRMRHNMTTSQVIEYLKHRKYCAMCKVVHTIPYGSNVVDKTDQ
jgi:hypothetical protein